MKKQKIAAIDIGSNSIKLVIVEADSSDSFTIVLQERERVRLGRETLEKQFLSERAVERSAEAVAKLRATADSQNAEIILAVATASVREAVNAADFVAYISEKTCVNVKVLSALEEARLIGVAAAENCGVKKGRLLNIDIGGGSTELSLMHDGAPEKLFSMKLGAVGSTEKFLFSNPPSERELINLRGEIAVALDRPQRELKNENWQIASGTSGTILNLATLLNFQTNSKSEIDFKRLTGLNEMLARMTVEERAKVPFVSPQRAEVIVAGGQILEGIMRVLEIQTLQPCTFALREGVIIDYLRGKDAVEMSFSRR